VARDLGLDVVSVHEIDRLGLSDEEQLRFAATEGRILVTRNRDDFLALTTEFYRRGKPHRGVLIVTAGLPNNRRHTNDTRLPPTAKPQTRPEDRLRAP
jgi:hypothetical protein